MEKFHTHAGPKTFDDIVAEITKRPKPSVGQVFAAQAVLPGENPNETVKLGPATYEVRDSMSVSAFNKEVDGFFAEDSLYAGTYANTATGPVGPSGPFPSAPGANGPAGPLHQPTPTAPASSGMLPERDRAEVDLRQGIRRCLKEGVPLDRIVEIFRLELVDVVHDD